MMTLREQLLDNMIKKYGHEHPDTIDFAQKIVQYNNGEYDDKLIQLIYYWKTLRLDKEIKDEE